MEITCTRCHQTVEAENCYCPACGLPRLTYSVGDAPGQALQAEQPIGSVRDAGSVDWKQALRIALILALPAGLLSSGFLFVGFFGFFWMAAAGAWAVVLYVRRERTPWLTIGAGARIGLAMGLLGSWIAAACMGLSLFALRFVFHQGRLFDDFWQSEVVDRAGQQWAAGGIDTKTIGIYLAMLNSPEGRVGMTFFVILSFVLSLLIFATAGGALGARFLARGRRTEI